MADNTLIQLKRTDSTVTTDIETWRKELELGEPLVDLTKKQVYIGSSTTSTDPGFTLGPTKAVATGSATGTANVATDTTNPYLNLIDPDSKVKSSNQLIGVDNISVVADSTGAITIKNTAAYTDTPIANKYVSEVDQSAGQVTPQRRTLLEETTSEANDAVANGSHVVITSIGTPDDAVGISPKKRVIKGNNGITLATASNSSDVVVQHTNSVTAKTVYEKTADKTKLLFGGTFKIPEVLYDAQGHVTASNTAGPLLPDLVEGNGIDITVSDTNTYIISADAGNGITVTADGINHEDTSDQTSVTNNGRTYIQSVTLDTYGHVTKLTSATETVTDTNQKVKAGTVTFENNDVVNFVGSGATTVTGNKDDKKITISSTDTKVTAVANHYSPATDSTAGLAVDANSTTAATWGSTSVVTGVNLSRDAKGHVTGLSVDSIKFPSNPDTDHNQTVKAGAVTFGTDDTINFAGTTPVSVTGNASNDTITISVSDATTSSSGLMTATDKTKLDGIETGANKTVVDTTLSSTSTNPVQNNIINTALASKVGVDNDNMLDRKIVANSTEVATLNTYQVRNIYIGDTDIGEDEDFELPPGSLYFVYEKTT